MSPLNAGLALLWRNRRVWLLFYGITLAFAAVAVLPAAMLLRLNLGRSLSAARLFDNFDPQFLVELVQHSGYEPFLAFVPAALILGLSYLVLTTFLTGGALAVFTGTDTFWSGCGRNFLRLLRIALLAFIGYLVVLAFGVIAGSNARKLWGEGLVERPLLLFAWARAFVTVMLFLFVSLVFDYARIFAVSRDSRSSWLATLDAVFFLARNLRKATALYIGLLLAGIVGLAAYRLLSTSGILIVTLILQQAFIAFRLGLRLLLYASQSALAADPVPAVTLQSEA